VYELIIVGADVIGRTRVHKARILALESSYICFYFSRAASAGLCDIICCPIYSINSLVKILQGHLLAQSITRQNLQYNYVGMPRGMLGTVVGGFSWQ
jgi:hypothetical protein